MNRVTLSGAVEQLRQGQVVAFPTDTAYGLAVDARNVVAVARVRKLKGRDTKKPIALVAADLAQVQRYFFLTAFELKLAKKYWPGPLTLVLTARTKAMTSDLRKVSGSERTESAASLSSLLAAKRIGVRVPKYALARKLAAAIGAPLTATSANKSGQPTCYTASAVHRQLPGVPILGNQKLRRRPVSTIAEVHGRTIKIFRSGPITPTFT